MSTRVKSIRLPILLIEKANGYCRSKGYSFNSMIRRLLEKELQVSESS